MPPEEKKPAVTCPVCRHQSCDVLVVGSDPSVDVPKSRTKPQSRPTVHAVCPRCGTEFHITKVE